MRSREAPATLVRGAAAHRLRRDRAVARLHRHASDAAALSPPRRPAGRAARSARNGALLGLFIPLLAVLPLLALMLRRIARRELRVVQELEGEIGRRSGSDLSPHRPRQACPPSCNRWASMSTGCSAAWSGRSTPSARWPPTPRTSCARRSPRCACACRPRSTRTCRAPTCRRRSTRSPPSAIAPTSCCSFRAPNRRTRSRASRSTWSSSPPPSPRSSGARRRRGGGSTWRSPRAACVPARGDVDSLAIALRNLVENALRYGGDARVAIEVVAPCALVVRDDGPGVARRDPRNPAPPPRAPHPGRRRLRSRAVDRRHHRRQARRPARAQLAAARPRPRLRSANHPASGGAGFDRGLSAGAPLKRISGIAAHPG